MDTYALRPRQFRMMNTGTQQSLGSSHSTKRTAQVVSQLCAGFMDAIGQVPFSMRPYIFHRVQFRRVAWKLVDMQTRLLGQECLDVRAPVNFSAIPNNEHVTSQMTQQLAQKKNNLQSCDIVGMESRIKPQPPSSGRHSQNADDRYFVPPVAVPQDRGLANGSPCPTDIGNQKKAAFVEKPQMGTKSFGLFLYAAKPASSTDGFHPRPAAMPAFQVSGNSSSIHGATASIRPQTCNEPHTALQQVSRSVSMSTTLWYAQPPQLLSATLISDRLSVPASGDSDAPNGHASLIPSALFSGGFGAIGPRCLMMLLFLCLRRERSFPSAAKPRLDTDVTPTVCMFHMVSYQKYSMYPLNVKEQ